MNSTELAVIANALGGINQTADELQIDGELLQSAINGELLTRDEEVQLDIAVNDYEKDMGFDFDLSSRVVEMQLTEQFIADEINIIEFRNLFAEQVIESERLDVMQDLFANLNPTYIDAVIEYVADGNDIQPFIENFEGEYGFWDMDNTEFWEWFRETFYND